MIGFPYESGNCKQKFFYISNCKYYFTARVLEVGKFSLSMQMMQYAFYPTNMSSQNVGQILKGSTATLALNIDNWQHPGKLLLKHRYL